MSHPQGAGRTLWILTITGFASLHFKSGNVKICVRCKKIIKDFLSYFVKRAFPPLSPQTVKQTGFVEQQDICCISV